MTKRILIPLPAIGFDPTEVSVPWKVLSEAGYQIVFATPDGKPAIADQIMLTGKGLGIWKGVLRTADNGVQAHDEMVASAAFAAPIRWDDVDVSSLDALVLPGGHDKIMRPYLESEALQAATVAFFAATKPVGAICHGVVLAARSVDAQSGKSVLHGYKTTSLLKSQEMLAYNLTRWWMGDYYLTYPGLTVEDEVRSVLRQKKDFKRTPAPSKRDSADNLKAGFTVRDRNYLSARWPGDAFRFSTEFAAMLAE